MRLIKFGAVSFILLFFVMWFSPTVNADIGNIPSGSSYFSGKGVLTHSTGVEDREMFKRILRGKQLSIIEGMINASAKGFSESNINVDLTVSNGNSLWNYDLNNFYSNTSGTVFKIIAGTVEYKIYVPPGRDSQGRSINSEIISNTVSAIKEYKNMVAESILAGSMALGVNVYSMYAEKQVPLTDILEDGGPNGAKKIKTSVVPMEYSLDYFYHPLFGKIDAMEIKKGIDWNAKVKDVKFTVDDKGNVDIAYDSGYLSFVDPNSPERETLSEIKSTAVVKADGVKQFIARISGKKLEPKNLVDSSMRLMVPKRFSKKLNVTDKNYDINHPSGYRVIDEVKLLITHFYVYEKSGEGYERKGDYATYGIDVDGLVLYYAPIDQNGNISVNGKKVGVVIPLWYKEVVVNTNTSTKYFTGREVKFGNDYSGKIGIDKENRDLLSVDSKTYGKKGIQLRKFAFPVDANPLESGSHIALSSIPEEFDIAVDFSKDENLKGFIIYRNNWYVDDPDLILWLETNEARAMTDVKAEELYKLITGSLSFENRSLSYDEWVMMNNIKHELDKSKNMFLISLFRVLGIILGFMLIIYSVFLVLAYWFDILNTFVDISILNLMTFRRLYPVSSQESIEYLQGINSESVRYVTFWHVLVLSVCGIIIGLIQIFSNPLIEFFIWLYFKITGWGAGF